MTVRELVFKHAGKPSVNDMWFFIDEVLPKYGEITDRDAMNYDEVFQLFSAIKESYHLFQILAQTAVLKKSANKLQLLQP